MRKKFGEKIGERRKQITIAVSLFGCIRYKNNCHKDRINNRRIKREWMLSE